MRKLSSAPTIGTGIKSNHLATLFAARCRAQNVHQFTYFQQIADKTDYVAHPSSQTTSISHSPSQSTDHISSLTTGTASHNFLPVTSITKSASTITAVACPNHHDVILSVVSEYGVTLSTDNFDHSSR